MDVERRLIIMRRIAGAVGTAVLQVLKWMLKMFLENSSCSWDLSGWFFFYSVW